MRLSDVVFRRTDMGTAEFPGDEALNLSASLMAAELGWGFDRLNREIAEVRNLNQQPGEALSLKMENVYWFALEGGFMVRAESTMTQEMTITVGSAVGGGAGDGGGGGRPGIGAGGGGRPGIGAGGGGSRTAAAGEWMNPGSWRYNPGFDNDGNWRFFRRQGCWQADEGGSFPGAGGGTGPGTRTGGGSGGVTKQVLRITMQVVTELER